MAIRVSADEVRQVIKLSTKAVSDVNLLAHINVANRLVDDLLANEGMTTDRLKDIERYLSAHFSALFDRESMSAERKIGDAETEYYLTNAVGKYLDLTVWGQTAKLLDTSGTLVGILSEDTVVSSRKDALFKTFG